LLALALPALAEPIGSELDGAGGAELSWLQAQSVPRRSTGKGPLPDDHARMRADGNYFEPIYVEGADAELVAAVRAFDRARAEKLLKAGANVNARDVWGTQVLALAARGGDVDLVRLLLDFGAVPDARGEGFTPLGAAALDGNIEILRALLAAGADPDLKSANGRTPLMEAAIANRPDIARVLMAAGAAVELFSRDGNSALSLAAMNGFHEVLARMLDLGADPNLWDQDRRQPLWWAVSFEHRRAVQVLLEHGAQAGAMSVEPFLD
jgi:ankyrin repeat protein